MKASFARGIARNIRDIAENTAIIVLMDREPGKHLLDDRTECLRAIQRAENNIAQWLQQPGTYQDE